MLWSRVESEGFEEYWVYKCACSVECERCQPWVPSFCTGDFIKRAVTFCEDNTRMVEVPIDMHTVGVVERAIHAASTATKGPELRSHGTFISHLVTLECAERYKQALCCWAPTAMMGYMRKQKGSTRKFVGGRPKSHPQPPSPVSTHPEESLDASPPPVKEFKAPPGLPPPTSADCAPLESANKDCDGSMLGTRVEAGSYGEETRVSGVVGNESDLKPLAFAIGPDLIPAEVMDSCTSNLQAGLAKRVQPLPFKNENKNDKMMIRKIEKVVSVLIKEVFSKEKIKAWRRENPNIEEFASKKWSASRFNDAMNDALSDTRCRIEQTFQIKQNECLPAKGKAPRPIIQCGDRAQVMMSLPVKCFEELLFAHFEDASIKHLPKFDAMKRVADRFRFGPKVNLIEGDGSAWDACCNKTIRSMTENRILEHIISTLGDDAEVPKAWFKNVMNDLKKDKLKGKAKVSDATITPIRVVIDAIRQSGHRGTSCFNYLINLVCWLCVMCEDPAKMIQKCRGDLQEHYKSAHDGKWYLMRYAFEGDDSAICTTEDVGKWQKEIEEKWTRMGFRMKLVFVEKKMTFTGFDFLCDEHGPTGHFVPEVARNIASSSWSCSAQLKSFPWQVHQVGAAAMLARAENFHMCGPYSNYFASLGMAHVKKGGDLEIGETEALKLGISVVASVKDRLQQLIDSARPMSKEMEELVNQSVPMSNEQQLQLLSVHFEDPFDLQLARQVVPFSVWDPSKFCAPRR